MDGDITDGYGFRKEMKWLVFAFVTIASAAPLSQIFPLRMDQINLTQTLITLTGYSGIWYSTCLLPLYQSYQHQRVMTQRLAAITNDVTVVDTLAIPACYEGIVHALSLHRRPHLPQQELLYR
jgi:hypothetical protein